MEEREKFDNDLVHLARVALAGRVQDVQAFLHRLAKQHRTTDPELASALTDLLRQSPTRASPLRRQGEVALPVDLDTRFQLLRVEVAPHLDHEPVYTPDVELALRRIVDERLRSKSLFDAGLEPTKTALFVGPPGVGKTMAARWLARSLGRPLVILDLAAVMSSYLGRTGTNLRHVLEYAKSIECVLLLDELDAIAKRRDDRGEIGELKRLVTVLIQQVDDWPSSGLLIGATNHADLLDPAIWRRFEATISFPLPTTEGARRFVEAALSSSMANAPMWSNALALAFQGKSFSDIERDLKGARREAALSERGLDDALLALIKSEHLTKAALIELASTLVKSGVVSQHQAHKLTGIARDTIRAHSKQPRSRKAKERA